MADKSNCHYECLIIVLTCVSGKKHGYSVRFYTTYLSSTTGCHISFYTKTLPAKGIEKS